MMKMVFTHATNSMNNEPFDTKVAKVVCKL